ncbi:Glycoprotein [Caenorhabditis elegans]|uniref:Glycoprotein n=1 Tax=Caenorhabditis elegans TaxID=6239 RepID=A8XK66_CAEEL|nr:Glycoprotein [Caenorhabditis elegans]CAP16294.1 Glycoprotein [Caenorhabditis elegans]|eukprot:NP_001123043.1 Uncharacterized protein CELE_Y43F8B.18 [Caenorhabditis elegans]
MNLRLCLSLPSLLSSLVSGIVIYTRTNPPRIYDFRNIPLETNRYFNFVGYSRDGRSIVRSFSNFGSTIIDDTWQTYLTHPECVFDIIGIDDMLAHCKNRLYRMKNRVNQLLNTRVEAFTFDHVQNQLYTYNGGTIYRLQDFNFTVKMWSAPHVRDFNIVDGLLTVLHTNGSVLHNGTILARLDPSQYQRLPIYAAPSFKPWTDDSLNGLINFMLGSLTILLIEHCSRKATYSYKKRRVKRQNHIPV